MTKESAHITQGEVAAFRVESGLLYGLDITVKFMLNPTNSSTQNRLSTQFNVEELEQTLSQLYEYHFRMMDALRTSMSDVSRLPSKKDFYLVYSLLYHLTDPQDEKGRDVIKKAFTTLHIDAPLSLETVQERMRDIVAAIQPAKRNHAQTL
jgi:hypothetical protein